jgi:serine/threonine-protein kinase
MFPTQFSHYRILSKIGAGGMGEVYLAEDTRLKRRVALKVLPQKFTEDRERLRRFEQEAQAASRLNHPNVMTIYEIGEVDGTRFIATEFIEGQTLRERLRQGRIPLSETLSLAVQLAAALTAMHSANIAHRDLKPENIMLRTDGYLKVLDFGLAKLTETELFNSADPNATQAETAPLQEAGDTFASFLKTSPNAAQTTPGMILGTLRYMSPEQARGQAVDARTDLFSLGVILYEMLAGRLPFDGPTTGDILVALLDRTPQPLARYAPETSPELQGVINRLLAKDCADRYQTADELHHDLKRLQQGQPLSDSRNDWLSIALNQAGNTNPSASGASASRQASSPSGSPSRTFDSLAVLPFANVSGKDEAAYLSEGIPESLIFNLARLPQLRVIAYSTVQRYPRALHGQQQDPLAIGRELGVRAVLVGRLHQFSDKLVIKVELVNTADGTQIWGEQYQRPLADILALEQELTEELCRNLKLRLNDSQQEHLQRRATVNAEAYQAYLQGRFHWHQRNARAMKLAIAAFQRALTLDPEFALAFVGFADCLIIVGSYGAAPPLMVMPQAKQALLRALQLNESLAEAHASLGAIYGWFEWDWAASEREFQRALQLNPTYATASHWYASILLSALARHDEARRYQWQAHRQEPLAFVFQANLGWIEYQARNYAEAARHCERVLELDPTYVHARFYLGLIYAQLGRFDEAIAVLQRAYELAGEGDVLLGALGYVYARAGQREQAAALVAELMPRLAEGKSSYLYLAQIYAGLGETESALQAIEGALEERCCYIIHLKTEPMFDGLRSDARFKELLRKVGLPA